MLGNLNRTLPTGGVGGGGGGGGGTFTNATPTPVTLGGITAGSTFSAATVQQLFDQLLYPYIAPTVTLVASPAGGVREFGNPQAPVGLTATTVRHTNPISSVIFQRSNNGGAYTTINTVGSPNPAGGAEVYSDATGVGGFALTQYRATVGDGTSTTNSNVITDQYVYPYYRGVGAAGLDGAAIGALTKDIVVQGNYTRAFSPTSQKVYYAYIATYPDLTSIIDQNGFNVTSGFTQRLATITGLDGTPQSYKVYESNLTTTQTGFNYTFNH
jgi:hypothetical protein